MYITSIFANYFAKFRTPLLSGQLAIPQGWPLDRGLIVYVPNGNGSNISRVVEREVRE